MALLNKEVSSINLPRSPFFWAGVVSLSLIGWAFASWYRLRQFKGPFSASFSYFFILRTGNSGRQGDAYGEVIEKYGDLARIGPSVLITSNPELIRHMNSARTRYRRADYYRALRMDPFHDSLFSLVDGEAHDKLKAKMSHGYGGKEVPTLEQDIDGQVSALVNLLRTKYARADSFQPADLASLSQYFTIDVLSKIAYGEEFGNLRTDSDIYAYVESSMELIRLLVICAEIPFCRNIFMSKPMLKMFGPDHRDKLGMGKILGISRELVSKRFAPDAPDELDMLGSFKRHGCTQLQCEGEIPFQIVAGSDTTAHAIRGTLLHLMSAPHTYKRLQGEIDAAISEGAVSDPIKASEAKQLPYLQVINLCPTQFKIRKPLTCIFQAVIYEGLRLSLPATLLCWKQAPPEGDTINGRFIPGGTQIAVSVKGIMRNREVFGDDASLFRPERWLNLDPAKKRYMTETTEMNFGHGRWGCSGKPVAFLELNKIFVELLRNFDFQLVNPNRAVDFKLNIQVHMEKGMWVHVIDRKAGKE
ncbi:cytochrome P450 [Stachybotrys elegans]|uniref:Cytochrome P450 n=1 Tax=Stachybotrys elegans TaxID=80388 RepID=A0A8K0SHR6_9HYPO|nr:cytochrome P450 [Stachybotrys elegans]